MPFRLRTDTRKWFKDITTRLGAAPAFDMYYCCLLAGLAGNRLAEAKDSETTELVDNFPGEYASKGRVIAAVFLCHELRRQGVALSDRRAVDAAIRRLVDPDSPSRLSAEGIKLMNQYSFGGFEVLTEWFPDSPRQLETFLPIFHRKLKDSLSSLS